MNRDIVKKQIVERGCWEIIFQPTQVLNTEIELGKLKEFITQNAVSLRGWDYPHIPRGGDTDQALYFGDNFVEGYIAWDKHNEIWRAYQSGQFIHQFSMWEDWMEKGNFSNSSLKDTKPGEILSTVSATYTLTEIFEFLRGLVEAGLYNDGVKITVRLNKVEGRRLEVLDFRRGPLYGKYESKIPVIEATKIVSREDILIHSREIALEFLHSIFLRFNWENQPIQVFEQDQEKLLTRNIW